MIYQFDCNGKMIASHKSARAAAEWIQKCTPYDVANNIYECSAKSQFCAKIKTVKPLF